MLPLLMFALVSTATPGPNNIMMLSSGLNFGIRRSIPHWLGICSGVPVMIIIFGFGLDKVIEQWPLAFTWLKVIGGSYLLYLAFKIASARISTNKLDKSIEVPASNALPVTFFQAVLFQWVNPKAWVMCLSAIPAFTPTSEPMLPQVLVIAMIFCLVGLAGVGAWLFTGSQIQRWLKNPSQQRMFNWSMAFLLVLSIIPMVKV